MLKGPEIGPITGHLFTQHHRKDYFTLGNFIIRYFSWLGQLHFSYQITWILVRNIPPHTLTPYSNLRIYFTRFLSDADISTRLQQRAAADRARASTPDDVFLLNNKAELGLTDVWTKGRNRISKDGITYAVAGYYDHNQGDDAYMTRFISKLRPNGVYHPGTWSLTDVYPMGGPLMDIVVADIIDRHDSWKTIHKRALKEWQSHRNLIYPTGITVKEIIIGETPGSEVDLVREFIRENYRKDQVICPTGVMSCDTEGVQVAASEYLTLPKTRHGKEFRASGIGPRIKGKSLPVRFMLGNGYSWAVMIINPSIDSLF